MEINELSLQYLGKGQQNKNQRQEEKLINRKQKYMIKEKESQKLTI